ncbi:MAG: N-6 DNA methylase, partial [Candidatus Parcubacteria bacterium]|nr:N-6 DNA methylase [Candidatus Parcubacteria bacterium]
RKELIAFNKKLSRDKLEECIQRLLNRLIFIRTIEDRGIENKILQSLVREYERLDKKNGYLTDGLRKIFADFNGIYDSKLFEPHIIDSDKFEIVEYALAEVIDNLYKTKAGIRYNFDQIPADILGSIYEQYLGHIQREGEAKDSKSKRKSQGIYYTPRYIVDYIVKNTVGEYIKGKSLHEVQKIKILDPACGSGSFLIRAFEELDNYLEKEKNQTQKDDFKDYLRKIQILSENIYGVDLDDEAVELTRLNLLLKTATRKHPLPDLAGNIKNGNSLISGTEAELKKYFGKDWEDKKPFNWNEEFKDVFKQGGFDVVIGNPPWGADIDDDIAYYEDKYPNSTQQHKDIYKIFVEKAINLLRDDGIFSFIIPNTILLQPRFKDIREYLNQFKLLYIINLGEKVFEGVEAPSCVIVCQKAKKTKNHNVKILDLSSSKDNEFKAAELRNPKYAELQQAIYDENPDNAFVTYYREKDKDELTLGEILDCKDAGINYQRMGVGMGEKGKSDLSARLLYEDKNQSKNDRMYYKGEDIGRYFIKSKTNRFVRTNIQDFIKKNEVVVLNDKFFNLAPKLLWRQTADKIIATLDNKGVWFGRSIQAGVITKEFERKVELVYILSLINSKYLNYLYTQLVKEAGRVFPQVKLSKVKQLPIKLISLAKQQPFIELAKKMITFKEELQKIDPIMDKEKYEKKKKEIEEADGDIDKLVYKLYGLDEKDIKMIGNN